MGYYNHYVRVLSTCSFPQTSSMYIAGSVCKSTGTVFLFHKLKCYLSIYYWTDCCSQSCEGIGILIFELERFWNVPCMNWGWGAYYELATDTIK